MGAPALLFVDTETTGLDSARHEVYEVSLTKATDAGVVREEDSLYFWIEPTQMHLAEPGALQVGRYYERRPSTDRSTSASVVIGEEQRYKAALQIAAFTEGCHLVGAKPSFDADFLAEFLRRNGACPAWHHRLIDVESLAIGLLVGRADSWGRPMSLSEICTELDIKRNGHDARGDSEAVRHAFFKLMGMAEEREKLWQQVQLVKAEQKR